MNAINYTGCAFINAYVLLLMYSLSDSEIVSNDRWLFVRNDKNQSMNYVANVVEQRFPWLTISGWQKT